MVKLRLRDNESVNEAVRRFRKLVEHAGVKKEMRKREFYEKPSDIRRRDRRRADPGRGAGGACGRDRKHAGRSWQDAGLLAKG